MTENIGVLLKIDSTPQSAAPLALRIHDTTRHRRGSPFMSAFSGKGAVYLFATGGTGGYVFSVVDSSAYDGLPPGLSLNTTTGLITGTPTAVGRFRFRARVQDSSATAVEEDFTIDIIGRMRAENVTPVEGESLTHYSYTFTVSGNTGTVTWSHVDGTLPSGLSLSPDGVLSGTPSFSTTNDTYYFKVRATDSGSGDTLDVVCKVVIWAVMLGFAIEETWKIFAGQPFGPLAPTLDRTGGGKPPYTYQWDLSSWPTISFDQATRTFSGIVPISSLTVGIEQTIVGSLRDALGVELSPVLFTFLPVFAQEKTSAAENGLTVADGPTRYNFVDGINTTAHVQPNSDGSVDVSFDAAGGGATGGITIQIGTDPSLIVAPTTLATQVRYFQAPADLNLTGWQLAADRSCTVSIDVRKHVFPGLPGPGDSMTNSHPLTITTGTSNTGNMAGWTSTSISRGDWVAIALTANDAATWLSIQLQGTH